MFKWSNISVMVSALYDRIIYTNASYKNLEEVRLSMVENAFVEASKTFLKTKRLLSFSILQVSDIVAQCFRASNKMLVCGNGGSAQKVNIWSPSWLAGLKYHIVVDCLR